MAGKWHATLLEQIGGSGAGQGISWADWDWRKVERHYFDSEEEAKAYVKSRIVPQVPVPGGRKRPSRHCEVSDFNPDKTVLKLGE